MRHVIKWVAPLCAAAALWGCEGPAGPAGAAGENGQPGLNGVACWDQNGDGVQDPGEDTNNDGRYDAADCLGLPGQDGDDGQNGNDGASGTAGHDGEDGAAGLACWDLNGDGVQDADEDVNGDGAWDVADCRAQLGGYAGSDSCKTCHAEQFGGWVNSGHPYKIVPATKAAAGNGYPAYVQAAQGEAFAVDADFFSDQASTIDINANTFPNGWDDISYVIGGFGWKARFIDKQGYIITGQAGDKVQYNFPNDPELIGEGAYGPIGATGAEYHAGQTKPYTCGSCHTTGWIPDDDADTDNDLSDNQDGLPGIHGTWEEPGVSCEGCHGPSAAHVADPHAITTPKRAQDSCAGCHRRGYIYQIDTSGGFIKHHEQGEELVQSKHAAIGCSGCHDPHQTTKYQEAYMAVDDDSANDPNPGHVNRPGIRVACESCHIEETLAFDEWVDRFGGTGMRQLACIDCHMPKAAKSAVKVGTYAGDVPSHLFGINPDADFTADPTVSTTGRNPANPYLSLDFVCGSCHADKAEDANFDFYLWASTRAQGIHHSDEAQHAEATPTYVGMATCATCHPDKAENVKASGHPYKIVSKDDVVAGTAYPQYVQDARGEEFAVDADLFSDQAGVLSINANTFPNGWDDISYVIGGYGWKARFIDNQGYIITGQSGDLVQYNPPFDPKYNAANAYGPVAVSAAEYHAGQVRPYNCGTCHTTGWVPDDDALTDGDLSDNQDGLPGIYGTWVDPGVTCEGCHGPGSAHAADPAGASLPTGAGAGMCEKCHTRGSDHEDVDISGGFIKHHEQYEELTTNAHFGIGCVECHDPHRPVKFADAFVAADGQSNDPVSGPNLPGIRKNCRDCHQAEAAGWDASTFSTVMPNVECVDCHMPRASKSAVKAGERSGDLRTHIFRIDPTVNVDTDLSLNTTGDPAGARPYISLDWACGACHADEYGTGNDGDIYDWASTQLTNLGPIH